MKSTFLRMLFLSVASAVFLRAISSIQDIAPARLTAHPSNNPDEESFIAIWGFSPCGGGIVTDENTVNNGGTGSRGIAQLWQARNENDFCICELPEPSVSEAAPLLAFRGLLFNGQWAATEKPANGLWESGWSGCGCISDSSSVPDMIGDGVRDGVYEFRRSDTSPDCKWSVRVEAIEFSRTAQVVLVGDGLKTWTVPIGIGASDVYLPCGIPEETRLMLVGGPAAAVALDRSIRDGVLAERSERNEPSNYGPNSALYPWWCPAWGDFFDGWGQSKSFDLSNLQKACGLPLGAVGRAEMSSLVTPVAASESGWRVIIAADDGTLHLCNRHSGGELCRLEQSPDGVWRVIDTPNRFLSLEDYEDFAEPPVDSGRGEPDRTRLAAVDPFLRHYLLSIGGYHGDIFSFSLDMAR